LIIIGIMTAPITAVNMTTATVIALIPPKRLATSIAIGVVDDLGMSEAIISFGKLNIFPSNMTQNIETIAPTIDPIIIGIAYFLIKSICLTIGTAKQTINGPKNKLIPLKSVKNLFNSILNILTYIINSTAENNNGLNKDIFVF